MSAHIPSHPTNRDPEPQIIYNCQRAIHHFMEIPSQDDTPVTLPASTAISPTASTTASTNLNIDTSSYLSVPGSRFLQSTRSLAGPLSFEEELDRFFSPVSSNSLPQIVEPAKQRSRSLSIVGDPGTRQLPMSVCSTSSINSNTSSFSNPFAGRYRLPAFCNMSSSRSTITAVSNSLFRSQASDIHLRSISDSIAFLFFMSFRRGSGLAVACTAFFLERRILVYMSIPRH
jgi:hypothetical protein